MSGRGRSKSRAPAVPRTDPSARCGFCNDNTEDEATLGRMYALGPLVCHYYCVLLSCCLVQRGKDEEGLFGFLLEDIQAEIQRGKKYRCSYCGKGGATMGCCDSKCKKQFHLPCGRRNGSTALFFGNYKSYCVAHAPRQTVPERIMVKARARQLLETGKAAPAARRNKDSIKEADVIRSPIKSRLEELTEDVSESVCAVCYEHVAAWPSAETFWPPCCARDSWLHVSCLQRMALSAGMHYFKCPLCNDKDAFHEAVLEHGVYVPDRDAAWELEQDAYADMYERSLACGAAECKCLQGREYDADYGLWELKPCLLCGSVAAHKGCLQAERHICTDCSAVTPPENLAALDKMADGEQRSRSPVWRPIMPCRMSVRRTKLRRRPLPSRSCVRREPVAIEAQPGREKPETINTTEKSTVKETTRASRIDLGLKSPRKESKVLLLGSKEHNLDQYTPQKDHKQTPILVAQERANSYGTTNKLNIDGEIATTYELDKRILSPLKLLAELSSPRCMEVFEAKIMEQDDVIRRPGPLKVKKKIIRELVHKIVSDWNKENSSKEISEDGKPHRDLEAASNERNALVPENCSGVLQESSGPVQCSTPLKNLIADAKNNVSSVKSLSTTDNVTNTFSRNVNADFEIADSKNVYFCSEINEKKCGDSEIVDCKGDLKIDVNSRSFQFPILNEKYLDSALAVINVTTKKVSIDRNSSLEIHGETEGSNLSCNKIDEDLSVNDNPLENKIKSMNTNFNKSPEISNGRDNKSENRQKPKKPSVVDLEAFKSQYLSEIEPSTSYKCSYNHNHNDGSPPLRLKSAIDWAIEAVIQKKHKYSENASQLNGKDAIHAGKLDTLKKNALSDCDAASDVHVVNDDDVICEKTYNKIDTDNVRKSIKRKMKKSKTENKDMASKKSKSNFVLQKLKEEHNISHQMVEKADIKPQKSNVKNELSLNSDDDDEISIRYKNIRAFKIPKKRKSDDGIVETGKRFKTKEIERSQNDAVKRKINFDSKNIEKVHEESRKKHSKKHKSRRKSSKSDCETEISFNRRHLNLKIKWQKQHFNVKIQKLEEPRVMKQTLLNFSPDNKEVLLKTDAVGLKRKRTKHEVSPDGLKQTSISNFFTRK